jgi:Protein of unknown function (DUF3618)
MSEPEGTRSPEEIERDIEQTREQVGDTVEALAAKTDVKARARARVDEIEAKARAHTPSSAQEGAATAAAKASEHRMVLLGAGGLALAFWLGRRSGREP